MPYDDPSKARAWREANRERLAEKKAQEYLRDADAVKARSRAYNLKNAEDISLRRAKVYRLDPDKVKDRVNTYRRSNRDLINTRQRDYCKRNPSLVAADTARYAARQLQATPVWSCPKACKAVYWAAHQRTKTTGVAHDVDHIVPLRGRTVSGLHVPCNLAVVERSANRSKSNRTWPDMP